MNVHELTLQNYSAASGCPSACQPTLYLGTAGSYGNEQINVVLGEGWQGLTVKAVFQPSGVAVVVPDGGGVISVPWEATQSVVAYPHGRIVFEGVTDGRVLISADIPYTVGSHSDTEGSNSQPPTPSQWQQFVDEVKDDANRAESASKDAEATLQDVKDAGTQAVTDIGAAKDSALDAVAGAGASALEAIQQAGQTVTEQITQTGATQVGAVQSAGTTQVGLVNAAGQQQAENIAQAGSQQVQAVQTAGTAAVSTVNDARDDAVEEIETANAHAPQINPATGYWQTWDTEAGQYVDTTTKAQGATPQMTIGTVTTLEPGEDATANITGTAEAPVLSFGIPEGEPGLGVPTPTANDYGKAPTVNAAGTGYELTGPYAPLSAAIIETAKGNPAVCEDSVEWGLQGMRVYGKSTQDGTPSPENPVPIVSAGDDGSISITLTGKNLLEQNKLTLQKDHIRYGLKGDDTSFLLKAGTNYTLSVPNDVLIMPSGMYFDDAVTYSNLKHEYDSYSVSYTPTKDIYVKLNAYWGKGRPENATKLQLEVGSVATEYEAPKEGQSLTVSTPNGLPGIPVDSGGNYTDADGQQSACDVKDYGLGKYTQMVGHIESYNGENITTPYMSTTGQLSTGAEVYYVLDEPVVTDISADELAAYRALHTYDGATVITPQDALAEVEVDYIVKPKAYIEKKFTAIEQKIQEVAAAQIDTQTGG